MVLNTERYRANAVQFEPKTFEQAMKSDDHELWEKAIEEILDDPTFYQSIIGSLMCACVGARPDLAHTFLLLSQFSSCPNQTHLEAAKRVLPYLKGTSDWTLNFPPANDSILHGYFDASFANFIDDRKSCSGHVFRLVEASISWSSRKQATTAL